MTTDVLLAGMLLLVMTPPVGQSPSTTAESIRVTRLEQALRRQLAPADAEAQWPTSYSAAFVDLNGDGRYEVLVYVSGREWCGSGGCVLLVLTPFANSYQTIANVTIAQLPIRVLTTKTGGWLDVGLWVQGGGTEPGYEAVLSFNGKAYPSNPSVPPARRSVGTTMGAVVISMQTPVSPLFRR